MQQQWNRVYLGLIIVELMHFQHFYKLRLSDHYSLFSLKFMFIRKESNKKYFIEIWIKVCLFSKCCSQRSCHAMRSKYVYFKHNQTLSSFCIKMTSCTLNWILYLLTNLLTNLFFVF